MESYTVEAAAPDPRPDTSVSTSSVPTVDDEDSLYDFVDIQVSATPALSDHDMNTNEHAKHRRELLDLMNRLRSMGLAADLELPQIACIGSQSVGKSSLIESISGIALPRAAGTCTRCPIECRLRHSDEEWSAQVLLRFEMGKDGYTGTTKEIPFGSPMTSREEVQERIRRAQLAILNPSFDHMSFLTASADAQFASRTFSQNCVIVELSGKTLSDLNFVDLPGLIANVSDDRNLGDIQLVEKLVTSYIIRPSCLILLTISCENDYENQGAGRLARKHDPRGRRTIGVLTKPDRIERGTETPWLSMIRGDLNPLHHGWFSVKQLSAQELQEGISWEAARALDRQFFEDTAPWSTVEMEHRRRLGCANLIAHLGETLGKVILTRLPHICDEVDRLIDVNTKALTALPPKPSLDPLAEVLQLVHEFTREVSRHVEGDSRSGRGGLVQTMVASAKAFQERLRGITPVFRPVKKNSGESGWTQTPSFLPEGENWPSRSEHGLTYWLDDIVELAEGSRTRELPGEFPFAVKEELITNIIKSWSDPVQEVFARAERIFVERLTKLVDHHFGKHAYGGLRGAVMKIVLEKLEEVKSATEQELKFLLRMESLPFTLNSHYYLDYKQKFLAHYKFHEGDQNELVRKLREPQAARSRGFISGRLYSPEPQAVDPVESALENLRNAGLNGLTRHDLVKLLPADFSSQAALDIMASVRAYYQVAYKRFADTVPLAIDQRYIRALDETIQSALVTGLSISSPDARDRCAAWLAESQAVVRQRAELLDRKARLAEAKRELLEVPGVSEMRDKVANTTRRRSGNHTRTTLGPAQHAPSSSSVIDVSNAVAEPAAALPRVASEENAMAVSFNGYAYGEQVGPELPRQVFRPEAPVFRPRRNF